MRPEQTADAVKYMYNGSIFVCCLKSVEMGRGRGMLHAIVSQMAGKSMCKNKSQEKIKALQACIIPCHEIFY